MPHLCSHLLISVSAPLTASITHSTISNHFSIDLFTYLFRQFTPTDVELPGHLDWGRSFRVYVLGSHTPYTPGEESVDWWPEWGGNRIKCGKNTEVWWPFLSFTCPTDFRKEKGKPMVCLNRDCDSGLPRWLEFSGQGIAEKPAVPRKNWSLYVGRSLESLSRY